MESQLDGLNVIAVVQADGTLGDVARYPQRTRSVLIIDEAASPAQREALVNLAQQKAGALLGTTVGVETAPISVALPATCSESGCANVRAGDLVEIQTRCLGGKDHVCGNEEHVLSAAHASERRAPGVYRGWRIPRPGFGHPVRRSQSPQRLPGDVRQLVSRHADERDRSIRAMHCADVVKFPALFVVTFSDGEYFDALPARDRGLSGDSFL